MATTPFSYDPELTQSNTSSRAAAHPDLDPQVLDQVIAMPVHQIMELSEIARRDFQQIHENIRTFYKVSGSISTSQKATMATFLIQHPELIVNARKPVQSASTEQPQQVVQQPQQYQQPERQPAEFEGMRIAAGRPSQPTPPITIGGIEADIDEETGAYSL